MSKKSDFAEHCEKVAGHHAEIAKGFSGLSNHFEKMSAMGFAEGDGGASDSLAKCSKAFEKLASHHQDLSDAHAALAEKAEKAIEDRMSKAAPGPHPRGVVPDAPVDQRNRPFINRTGGAPDQRRPAVEVVDGQVDTSGLNAEIEDMFKSS